MLKNHVTMNKTFILKNRITVNRKKKKEKKKIKKYFVKRDPAVHIFIIK